MELNSAFTVTAPVEKVWATLMDIERVAGCLPGAQVLGKLSDDAYQLGVKVKLGPVTMQYRGQLDVAERDAVNHRAVLSGQAKETRGQGTAKATATMTLREAGGMTHGTIHTDLALSGKAAAMGKSVIGSVSDQLMTQFAANLQAMMDEPAMAGEQIDEPSGAVATAPATSAGTAPAAPAPAAPAAPAPEDVATENSLDALALARGIATEQLSDPRKLGVLALFIAILAFVLGRRSGRRAA